MRFSVDPWDPGYGTSLDAELGDSTAEIDPDVEVPADRWGPVAPTPGVEAPSAVLFVDGVRRVDAQVWIDESDGAASLALCASYAAGVVCCCPGEGAHVLSPKVRRSLITTVAEATDIPTAAGVYGVVAARSRQGSPPAQVLSLALQGALADVEVEAAAVARADHTRADDLMVVDGPLRGRQHLPRTVGYIKSHRSDYLPPTLRGTVTRLASGERTPVFRAGSTWVRHTWYLRLPYAPGAPWAGVVRVECSGGLPAAAAVALADVSQLVLPRYASAEHKDPRAPQNLYPIAGLERALRRQLGEPAMLYRALRAASRPAARPLPARP